MAKEEKADYDARRRCVFEKALRANLPEESRDTYDAMVSAYDNFIGPRVALRFLISAEIHEALFATYGPLSTWGPYRDKWGVGTLGFAYVVVPWLHGLGTEGFEMVHPHVEGMSLEDMGSIKRIPRSSSLDFARDCAIDPVLDAMEDFFRAEQDA